CEGGQPFPWIRGDSRSYIAIRNLLRVNQNCRCRPVLVWQKRYVDNRPQRDNHRHHANGPCLACEKPDVFTDLLRQIRFFEVILRGRPGTRAPLPPRDGYPSPCAADCGSRATSETKTPFCFWGPTVRKWPDQTADMWPQH